MSPNLPMLVETPLVMTATVALLFVLIFLRGADFYPLSSVVRDRRSIISFGAGMSIAYVFIHVMPELSNAHQDFIEATRRSLHYEGRAIYVVAMLGFLAYYGLEHWRNRLRQSSADNSEESAFRLQIGGFFAYVWLMSYLLVRNLEPTPIALSEYAVAIGFHFLGIDHALYAEYGAAYQRSGRWWLAAASILGWANGLWVALPAPILALLIAFISGAIIINNAIMELPTEKDGRFVPFLLGGVLYSLLLLPLR